MTLPVAPNPISLSQVNTELGLSSSAPITLNTRNVRILGSKLTDSSSISLSDLHGKTWNRHSFTIVAARNVNTSRDERGFLTPIHSPQGSISPGTYMDGTIYSLFTTTENLDDFPTPAYSQLRLQMHRPLSMGAVWAVNVAGIDVYNSAGTVLLKSVELADLAYFSQADTIVDSVNVKMTWMWFSITPKEHVMTDGGTFRVDIRYT
jgi:hypothetical protein